MYDSYISDAAKKEDDELATDSVWYSFRVDLPNGPDWDQANLYAYSVWSNGNNARDHWGYPGYASMSVSRPIADGGGYYVTVNLNTPSGGSPANGYYFGFLARARLRNGEFATVASSHRRS